MPYAIPKSIVGSPVLGQRCDTAIFSVPEGAAFRLDNFIRRKGVVTSRPGYTKFGSTLGERPTKFTLLPTASGSVKLVAASLTKWWNWSSGAWSNITGSSLTGTNYTKQLFRVFFKGGTNYLVGVNGIDTPKKWDGVAATYSDVGGSPGAAKCLGVLANRMLMANFSNNPTKVDVSSFNDFEAGWGSTQIVNLAETPGEIMCIQEMGNLVGYIWKTDAIYACTAVGAQDPFRFDVKKANIAGPLSPDCVITTPWGGIQYVLASDFNVYTWDGANYTPLGEHVRSHIVNTCNFNLASVSWGFFDYNHDEVWLFYPLLNYDVSSFCGIVIKRDGTVWPVYYRLGFYPVCGTQVSYTTPVTIGDLNENLSFYTSPLKDYSSYQKFQLLGSDTGQVYSESGTTDDGSGISLAYVTGVYPPSEEIDFVTLGEVTLFFDRTAGSQELLVIVFYSDSGALDLEVRPAQTVNLSNKPPFVIGERLDSRYFGLSLGGYATETVRLERIMFSGVERGMR